MPKFQPRGVPTMPVSSGAFPDPTPSQLALQRNPMRRELYIADFFATHLSGEAFVAHEAFDGVIAFDTPGVFNSILPLVLAGYTGEIHGVVLNGSPNACNFAELIDDYDQPKAELVAPGLQLTVPMRLRVRFFSAPFSGKGIILPVQATAPGSAAPVRVLEEDPNGQRRVLILAISGGFIALLSTSPTPGDTRSLFQYGDGVSTIDPIVFRWPFVPRSGLFAMAATNVPGSLVVIEGTGGG